MLQKIKSDITKFMQDNERDNLDRPSGFNRRLQDIYVAYFRQNMGASDTMWHQPWRKYADKEKLNNNE